MAIIIGVVALTHFYHVRCLSYLIFYNASSTPSTGSLATVAEAAAVSHFILGIVTPAYALTKLGADMQQVLSNACARQHWHYQLFGR